MSHNNSQNSGIIYMPVFFKNEIYFMLFHRFKNHVIDPHVSIETNGFSYLGRT